MSYWCCYVGLTSRDRLQKHTISIAIIIVSHKGFTVTRLVWMCGGQRTLQRYSRLFQQRDARVFVYSAGQAVKFQDGLRPYL